MRRFLLSLMLLACALPRWAVATGEVLFVVSEDQPAYKELADAVRAELARLPAPPAVRLAQAAAFEAEQLGTAQAIVAVGARAFRAVAASGARVPTVGALLPRSAFVRTVLEHGQGGGRRSAVFLDQPLGRQLELIRIALPERTQVGVLLGPESERATTALQAAAAERRIKLATQKVAEEKELHHAVQRLLAEIDVLLALPDPVVFNAGTVPHILLASYRQGVPVVGFSQAYVRAGAVLALYSTPAQLGAQTGEMVRTLLTTGQLPAPQHPRYFTVNTNPYVARSLGHALEEPAVLQMRLQAAERPN